jgi:OCT family organic cation transporter-like MFS transporter 16
VNFMILYLEESPKFMIGKDSAVTLKILNNIAKKNKKRKLKLDDVLEVQQHNADVENTGSSLFDLFRYKSLRVKSIMSGLVFFGIQIIYYSMSFSLGSVGLSIYVNQTIVGVSEGIGYLAAEIAIPKVKRKKASFIGMGLSSTLCFVLAFLHSNTVAEKVISICFLFVLRFSLSLFWAIFFVYLAEMFPTRVRSLAFGWASALGTVGSAASPYLLHVSDIIKWNSWLLPGILGALSTVCIWPLTETFGEGLEE